jgi:hypothetical protein
MSKISKKISLIVALLYILGANLLTVQGVFAQATTTPGVPSTAGGDSATNIIILIVSLAIALGGIGYMARKSENK